MAWRCGERQDARHRLGSLILTWVCLRGPLCKAPPLCNGRYDVPSGGASNVFPQWALDGSRFPRSRAVLASLNTSALPPTTTSIRTPQSEPTDASAPTLGHERPLPGGHSNGRSAGRPSSTPLVDLLQTRKSAPSNCSTNSGNSDPQIGHPGARQHQQRPLLRELPSRWTPSGTER